MTIILEVERIGNNFIVMIDQDSKIIEKVARVTFFGPSNVGKSSLLNALLECKIAAVSKKVQTTRFNLAGIINEEDTQLICYDTPGIFKPEKQLEKYIVKMAQSLVSESENLCMVIDEFSFKQDVVKFLIQQMQHRNQKVILVINKSDITTLEQQIKMTDELYASGVIKDIFATSATKNDGIDRLKKYLLKLAAEEEWPYQEGIISDRSEEFVVAEMTREKIYHLCHDELPYTIHVYTEEFIEEDDFFRIKQIIYVKNVAQRKIVIGEKAHKINKIVEEARKDMIDILQKRVHLSVFVKVEDDIMKALENSNW